MSAQTLAAMLNEMGVTPESGAPMLIVHTYKTTGASDCVQWSTVGQKWKAVK